MNSTRFRGVRITGMDETELVSTITQAAHARTGTRISFVNPHSFNLLATKPRLRSDLESLDVVCVDGIGVTWMVRLLNGTKIRRLSFDLLAPALLAKVSRDTLSLALVGGAPGVSASAAEAIVAKYPGIRLVGTWSGFLDASAAEAMYYSLVELKPQIVLVGAGAPLQERLAVELGRQLPSAVICTCGGYFDQVTRMHPYYPRWAYPLRINWAVRLAREPRRLWRRYLLGTPRFVVDSLSWRMRQQRTPRD